MAFPTSSAFTSGQTAGVSTSLNAMRADLASANGFVRKAADESVTSSTALQNDDHLFYTIPAIGSYVIDVYLKVTSAANAAGDIGVGFTFPTGTLELSEFGPDAGLASGTIQTGNWNAVAATSGTLALTAGASTGNVAVHIHGLLIATATGTLQFQWAQAASSASATTLKTNSHMLVRQVA